MKLRYLSAVALALSAAPVAAQTYVLDFNQATACTGGCGNNSLISQGYGDQANVDLTFRSLVAPGNSVDDSVGGARWYSGAYGDLTGVMYGGTSNATGVPELVFTPAAGFSVTLNSLDFAGWPLFNRNSSIRVYDLAYNSLFNSGPLTFPGTGHGTQTFSNISSASGLRLQWGPDGYDGGVDNISFSVAPTGVAAVPEPATWALMILGFGAVGYAMRRRRGRVAFGA